MSHCKSCGCEIRWIKTTAGKNIPLDAKPEKRFILQGHGEERAAYVPTYKTHFSTCPNAAAHRKELENGQESLF